jgi:hypothetical protein
MYALLGRRQLARGPILSWAFAQLADQITSFDMGPDYTALP